MDVAIPRLGRLLPPLRFSPKGGRGLHFLEPGCVNESCASIPPFLLSSFVIHGVPVLGAWLAPSHRRRRPLLFFFCSCGLTDAYYARQLPRVRRKVTRDLPSFDPGGVCTTREISTPSLTALAPRRLQEFRNLLFLPITPGRNARYLCPYLIVFVPADSIPHPDPPPLPSRSLYVLTRSRDLMRARYADYAAAPLAQVHVVRPSEEGEKKWFSKSESLSAAARFS